VVVPELAPSDCTKDKPATNWNSTYFDAIVRDFMAAVCGPDAITGACKSSVVQQLSTMPEWMHVNEFPLQPAHFPPSFARELGRIAPSPPLEGASLRSGTVPSGFGSPNRIKR
jgi:hypothetical protein